MPVTRGEFLRSLGKSIPGMVLNSGAAVAAQKLITKMAAASGAAPTVPATMTASGSANTPPSAESSAMARGAFINRGSAAHNTIALTFDDGPHPEVTPRLLDELKRHGAHATFFMIGRQIEKHPDIARRVLAEGHDIGNHTYTHPKLPELTNDAADEEIRRTEEIMASVLSHRTKWFRPPFGSLRADQRALVEKRGMQSILGDVSTGDWAIPPEEQILSKFAEATAGSIIICHDFSAPTANCLGQALESFLHRNLTPVTLSNHLAAA